MPLGPANLSSQAPGDIPPTLTQGHSCRNSVFSLLPRQCFLLFWISLISLEMCLVFFMLKKNKTLLAIFSPLITIAFLAFSLQEKFLNMFLILIVFDSSLPAPQHFNLIFAVSSAPKLPWSGSLVTYTLPNPEVGTSAHHTCPICRR